MKQRSGIRPGTRTRVRVVFAAQKLILIGSYWWFRLTTPQALRNSISWVVGPTEVASMTLFLSRAIPGSYSVALRQNPFYSTRYDFGDAQLPKRTFLRWIALPILVGRLMNRARGFIFVGTGYLLDPDYREFQFRFLKKHGLAVVCYFTGSDIRSTVLMRAHEKESGMPNVATYIDIPRPHLGTPAHDRDMRSFAEVADRYADAAFVFPQGHRNYLTQEVNRFLYLYPDDRFTEVTDKFSDLSKPVIVHAPSSPVIKGTPLVRAAIAQLRVEGYDFEYVELTGMPNALVMSELARAHIVLGHFYSSAPGVIGVEAMASACALVISADEHVELMLPPGSNDAWLVTKHWQVYDNIKLLLDEPERIEPLARYGQQWTKDHFTASANTPELLAVLDGILAGKTSASKNSASKKTASEKSAR
jgi:hypothetical protein